MIKDQPENNLPVSISRLILMSAVSVVLCFSMFMSIFTPYPIGLSSVLYGRMKGAIVALIAIVGCFFVVQNTGVGAGYFGFVIACSVLAIALAESVVREYNPMKTIVGIGLATVLISAGTFFSYTQSQNQTVKEVVLDGIKQLEPLLEQQRKALMQSNEKEAFEAQALLSQPELVADEVIKMFPSLFIVGLIVMLWANMFFLLKSNRLVKQMNNSKYSEDVLLNFRMPDQAIWFFIAFFALSMWGETLGPMYPVIGGTLLKVLGVFYFFHGFGIYLKFLDHLRIIGFFRSFMVVITIITASQVLALIGLLDLFVNFKKFFKKKD